MTDLTGKTALVMGSTSGIGQTIALAARGAHVLVVGRNDQRAKDVVAEIESDRRHVSTPSGKTVLITGANVGIGKDVARQLALRPEIGRIYLGCRNQDRASTAKA